jgi:hypothetical protein
MEPVVDRARCLMYVHTPRAVCMVPTRRGAYVDQGGPRRGQLEINCLPTTVCGDSAWDSVRGYIGTRHWGSCALSSRAAGVGSLAPSCVC